MPSRTASFFLQFADFILSLAARASFMGRGKVPNLPHIIIIPNAVVPQWHREIRAFFRPKTIEVHILNGNQAQIDTFFSSPAWQESTTPMIFRVILMQHSVCYFDLFADICSRI